MPLMILGMIVLLGCAKEEILPIKQSADIQQVEEVLPSLYSFSLADKEISFEAVSLESLQAYPASKATMRSNPHTNGHYTSNNNDTLTLTFSAMQNNGGVHGQSRVTGVSYDIHMSSECLEVDGNQAVFSGQITQANLVPPGTENILVVGAYLYWFVEDNGEGNNAPSDRYSERIFYSSEASGPLCYLIPPNSGAWPPSLIFDVANASDQIQVKD